MRVSVFGLGYVGSVREGDWLVPGPVRVGARALGNRSILADPRSVEMKDIVNTRIKFRGPCPRFAKPVVGGRSGGIIEAIADGVTGLLVDPQDPEDIANVLIRL